MATLLSNLNSLINDRRRDSTSDAVDMTTDGFRAIDSALEIWNQLHDWPWQIETSTFNYHQGIETYAAPTRFKAPVRLVPTKNTSTKMKYLSQNSFESKTLYSNRFAIATKDLKQRLKVKYSGGSNMLLHALTSLTDNGTIAGATAISNLSIDDYEGFEQNSSLKFDYSGTSGTITITGISAIDLTQYKDRSAVYLTYYPTNVTNLTSLSIKLGSDAGNYYSISATTDYLGDGLIANTWNRIKFDWANSSTTGTPDIAAIDYIQITIAFSVDPTNTADRLENLFIAENIPMTFEHYTTNMVYDVSGTTKIAAFNDASATTDYPLWSGDWDYATEPFVNSVLEYIFFMTGEFNERSLVSENIMKWVEPLRDRLPSKRLKIEFQIVPDINL